MKNINNKVILSGGALVMLAIMAVGLGRALAEFSDVPSEHPNAEAIGYVQSQNIVGGYPDGTFKPDDSVNRAELVKIIVGSQFSPNVIDHCIEQNAKTGWTYMFFPDVPIDAWYAKYVCVGKINGTFEGYPDGTFKPTLSINFAEAAKIIVRRFRIQVADDPIWYKPFVEKLGEMSAIPLSVKAFDQRVSRGEVAEMIYRIKAGITQKKSMDYETIEALGSEWETYKNVRLGFEIRAPKNWSIRGEGYPNSMVFYSEKGHIADNGCQLEQESVNQQDIMEWYKGRYEKEKMQAKTEGQQPTLPAPELFGPTVFNGYSAIEASRILALDRSFTMVYLIHGNDAFSCHYPDSDPNAGHADLYQKVASTFKFVDEEATDWSTFHNNKYEYTISYPSAWTVNKYRSEQGFTLRNRDGRREYIGGETTFSNSVTVRLEVYQIDPDTNYDKFLGARNFGQGKKTYVNLNGIGGLKLTLSDVGGESGKTSVFVFAKKDGNMFVFSYGGNPLSDVERGVANRVIGSFTLGAEGLTKDGEDASNWQSYQNEKFGYSVSYPPAWVLKESAVGAFTQKTEFAPEGETSDLPKAFAGVLSGDAQEFINSFGKDQNLLLVRSIEGVAIGDKTGAKTVYQNLLRNDAYSVFILVSGDTTYVLGSEAELEEPFVSSFKVSGPKVCTDPPVTSDAGRETYPIAQKYEKIQFLGELFTAAECGTERVGKIFGVDGGIYKIGSDLKFTLNPSSELLTLLKSIGYTCGETTSEANCKRWRLEKDAKVEDLIQLKDYSEYVGSNACVLCD